jgi:UDP-N-acetylmuramoyl-L-alanyl-D-glutamate--2,6-diaminopimelate ligase
MADMSKRLSDIITGLDFLDVQGDIEQSISGLSYDSRACKPGHLFFALPGIHTDGKHYIRSAVQHGAIGVVYEGPLDQGAGEPSPLTGAKTRSENIAFLRAIDCRWTMSAISSRFYDDPSDSLRVIGVTGTEGKSTTVSLIYQLLTLAGYRAGFFSTVMSDTGDGERPNPQHQTTPEATVVQEMLAKMRDNGLSFAVVEASSHGLSPRTARLAHVHFDIGVVTNVTHEHLEFHGTWEQYRSDKANLFRRLGEGGMKRQACASGCIPQGIICADDPSAAYFIGESAAPCLTYSSKGNPADLCARDTESDPEGSNFTIGGPSDTVQAQGTAPHAEARGTEGNESRYALPARLNLPGTFNVQNVLGAILAASAATGSHWSHFAPYLSKLKPVQGRMQRISGGQPFDVIIDYAHTPSSFNEILPPLRRERKGRILCVFGSGGERDRAKRPQQGRIAADNCDIVILTDEDPRGEDPMELLEEIASGCPGLSRGERLFLIPDRPAAIRKAFSLAKPEDLVLLLGKGHENSIIYADHSIPYDEETTARSILADIGFSAEGKEK